jgi:hypothetical protein
MAVPPCIIHLIFGFSMVNHPFRGTSHGHGPSLFVCPVLPVTY